MTKWRQRLRACAWIAMLAIAAAAFGPVLSRALLPPLAGGLPLASAQSLCEGADAPTRAGHPPGHADSRGPAGGAWHHLEHCPLCVLSQAPLNMAALAPRAPELAVGRGPATVLAAAAPPVAPRRLPPVRAPPAGLSLPA